METPVDLNEVLGPIAFKYCDARGLDILRNRRLKVTPPLYFNDPFEFTPHVVCNSPARRVKAHFQDKAELRRLYEQQKKSGYKGGQREFRRSLRRMRPQLIAQGIPLVPQAVKNLQNELLPSLSREIGVLCLSARADSLLMWGHYCSSHEGIVIGVDIEWERFRKGTKGLMAVKYVRERAIWDTSCRPGSSEESRAKEEIVYCKNADWRYEQELRQVFRLGSLLKEAGEKGVSYFLPVPASVIKCVILGLRTPAELENEVRSILSEEKLSHVSLWKAELHESQFALNFHCIKQGLSGSAREATV